MDTKKNIKSDLISNNIIAEVIKGSLETVEAILLHGSYARGDNSLNSDVDLIIITNSTFRTSQVKHNLEIKLKRDNISVTLLSAYLFDKLWKKGELFLLFALDHGVAIYGDNFLKQYETSQFLYKESYQTYIKKELNKTKIYEDYTKYKKCFRYPLSKLFVVFKKVAMFKLIENRRVISNKRIAIVEYFGGLLTIDSVNFILSLEKYTNEKVALRGTEKELHRALGLIYMLRGIYDFK